MDEVIKVTLPDLEYKRKVPDVLCFSCNAVTIIESVTADYIHKNKRVEVTNIKIHRCVGCGCEVISAKEFDRVLWAVRDAAEGD